MLRVILLSTLLPLGSSFVSQPAQQSHALRPQAATVLGEGEANLALYVGLFSATHVGLSAVRDPIIAGLGRGASALGLVGRDVRLPSIWLGDGSARDEATGQELVFPDEEIAGRQLFRIVYSVVAAVTLGGSFAAFQAVQLQSPVLDWTVPITSSPEARAVLFGVASVALGISLASLVNPSPLSLVPGFQADPSAPLQLKRDDSLKLRPYGLTRITRHPLILPVVPWGLANALLTGGRAADVVLFFGLALYALVGCYAQDLRAAEAAEVGTVFAKGDLTAFYATTSFVPFQAILDGRQRSPIAFGSGGSGAAIAAGGDADDDGGGTEGWLFREVPWLYLAGGVVAGAVLEAATLGAVAGM